MTTKHNETVRTWSAHDEKAARPDFELARIRMAAESHDHDVRTRTTEELVSALQDRFGLTRQGAERVLGVIDGGIDGGGWPDVLQPGDRMNDE